MCCTYSDLSQVWAATIYKGAAKELVRALKFDRAAAAADAIAAALAVQVPARHDWVIAHVPTVYGRARQRGYDQAQLIARRLAKRLGCAYVPLLVRQGNQRQVGQSRVVRQQQMATAFRASLRTAAPQPPVLLIDDVITTGATLAAAAHALRAAGVRTVHAAVFAAA